ncbi:MAG: hypothetical protein NTZ50_09485 [Chloroflexi bacterium]|nr:hypothetical protein [Chloroflexota bacterium]
MNVNKQLDLAQFAHDAHALAYSSRTVQTIAMLITVAGVLSAARMREIQPSLMAIEILTALLALCVLGCALNISRRPDLSLNASLRALAESPAFRQTITHADSRLQRIRRNVQTLLLHGCVLLDSFVWSRIATSGPSGLRVEHLHALTTLVESWHKNRSLRGVIDALAAQLFACVDGSPLRRFIEQLRASITPRRVRAAAGHLLPLATQNAPTLGCGSSLAEPASLNLRC